VTDVTDVQHALLKPLGSAQAVLFDFDGPVCDLFRGASTAHVARKIKRAAREDWYPLDPQVETCDDSHGILRYLRDMYDRRGARHLDRRPLVRAEEMVTEFEWEAARKAPETPHIATLVDLLCALGMRLVIVSNNAEGPIREYLERMDLGEKFKGVFGRDPENAGHMKPNPHCVRRALTYLSLPASSCLLVGDQISDLKAAREVRVPFLGYTQDEVRRKEMKHSHADAVVSSHLPVIEAAKELIAMRRASAPAFR
jgi:phosphoglycolate phosphatase